MAPAPEAYFPALDGCLSGETRLISWKAAFLRAVSPEDDNDDCGDLSAFLGNSEAGSILSNPFSPFPQPSERTKAEFESKIATANVTNKSRCSYDLDEIKKDATWLSGKVKINELSALRIVILEFQDRAGDQLLSTFSEEEINSLRDAVGTGNLSSSVDRTEPGGILTYAASRPNGSIKTDSDETRKSKLLRLFLSEKQHSIKLSQHLLVLYVSGKWSTHGNLDNRNSTRRKRLDEISRHVFGVQGREDGQLQGGVSIEECIDAVRSRINGLESGSGWSSDGPAVSNFEIELAWQECTLDELYQVTQILLLRMQISGAVPSSQQLLSWLRLMSEYNFLELFQPATEEQGVVFAALQSVISVATLTFLKLRNALSYFEFMATQPARARCLSPSNLPAILSIDNIAEINELFLQVGNAGIQTASPSLFAWGMIMYSVRELALVIKEEAEAREAQNALEAFNDGSTPSTVYDPESNVFEDLLERARNLAPDDDFIKFLLSSAVDKGRVFDLIYPLINQLESVSAAGISGFVSRLARVELLGLMHSCVEYLDYMPDLVSSTLHLISQPNYCRLSSIASSPSEEGCDPRETFLRDGTLMDRIFRISKSRFPFEAVNFLKICRALSGCHLAADGDMPFVARQLQHMETYTQMVHPGFHGYCPIREDENANFVSLTQPLVMREVASTEAAAQYGSDTEVMAISDVAVVPAETMGQVINASRPAVIMWHHQYNCLSFLGKWLEQWTNKGVSNHGPDEDIVSETVGLLADLLISADELSQSKDVESCARKILEMTSDGLHHYGDIISVIYDIFERCLHDIGSQAGPNRNLEPLVSCLNFINALVRVIPGRVWPFLARSSLLASDGKGGMLATVVSAVEASSGDFSFLLSSIRLFELLVDDAVDHAALRKTAGRVSSKSHHISEYTAGIPSHVMRNCLQSIVRTMVEVYNSNSSWRFDDAEQKLQVNTRLTVAFGNILYYGYGISDDTELDAKITGVLSTSAQYLLSIFRPSSHSGLPFNPILRIIFDGIKAPMSTANLRLLFLNTRLVRSALSLAQTLIQAGNLVQQRLSPLEKQLFNASPVLIRLYALYTDYRLPVASLLELLVSCASLESEQEPPSLLGHLGAESSCRFLDILSNFDRPFNDLNLRVRIWELLTTVVSKRQQWLAVYILIGSSPRDVLKSEDRKEAPVMKRRPFLATSLDLLSLIDSTPLKVAASALNFVAKSQENWPPWVKPELKSHGDFLPKTASYVSHLKLQELSPCDRCFNTKIAYLLADICTIYLHSAKESWDWTFFKTIIPLVSWLSENSVQVDGYNGSLHANLKRNFEMKYPGCSILEVKRTSLERPELGDNYFYDVKLGQKLFGYDFAWTASGKQGLMEEVKRANLNLSLVETQVALLHSFKFFAIEHCAYFMPDHEIQKTMARVVRQCLVANSQGVPNDKIFYRIQQVRVELAMALLQRLVDVHSRGHEVFTVLSDAWDTARSRHPTYDSALLNDDMEYYGSLLNVLLLALQFHLAGPHRSDPEALSKKPEVSSDLSIVLEIVKTIVARGFRSLTIYLHEESQRVSPKDFAVLTAILRTALKVKDVDRIYERMAFDLAESDAVRYAVTLFSWSYQLTIDGDPIYGELSILYLLELSCIPIIAEQMAVDGLLANLSTCRLTEVLRQPRGCGPFDPVPRLFSIWSSGLLRLSLNLLYHVGRTAPEVAAFLNQFDGQLRRASNAFSVGHATTSPSRPLPSSLGPPSSSQSSMGVSLGIVSEANSLALISAIIRKFRNAGPSAGVDSQQIQELKWDGAQVKDDIEVLLEKRAVLRSRISPTNETELAWLRQGPSDASSGAENLLEEKIVRELKAAAACIEGTESS